jgi:putative DNA primase/helicase
MSFSGPSIQDLAQGKWRSIHAAIGIPPEFLNPKRNGPCPMCGGNDRWRWTDKDGKGGWVCNQCGRGYGVDLVKIWLKCDFPAAVTAIREVLGQATEGPIDTRTDADKIAAMRKLWSNSSPIDVSGPVAAYLSSRGIMMPKYPSCLRQALGTRNRAMMLSQIIGADGKAINIQRTFLDNEGTKTGRAMMPGDCPHGSCVRLARADKIMGIAEGVETALSASIIHGIPVWSAISDGGLAAFRPPNIVKELWIFGDNDESFAGQAATFALAKALYRKVVVRIMLPPKMGQDWNDVLLANLGLSQEGAA